MYVFGSLGKQNQPIWLKYTKQHAKQKTRLVHVYVSNTYFMKAMQFTAKEQEQQKLRGFK